MFRLRLLHLAAASVMLVASVLPCRGAGPRIAVTTLPRWARGAGEGMTAHALKALHAAIRIRYGGEVVAVAEGGRAGEEGTAWRMRLAKESRADLVIVPSLTPPSPGSRLGWSLTVQVFDPTRGRDAQERARSILVTDRPFEPASFPDVWNALLSGEPLAPPARHLRVTVEPEAEQADVQVVEIDPAGNVICHESRRLPYDVTVRTNRVAFYALRGGHHMRELRSAPRYQVDQVQPELNLQGLPIDGRIPITVVIERDSDLFKMSTGDTRCRRAGAWGSE